MWNFSRKYRTLAAWGLWLVFCLAGFSAQAQEISVRVQVNRLPDGHYPTKVYQFSNTPGLVSLTLTNLSQSPQTVYLTGKLTGDNGVLVATPQNYQAPTTIELAPLATKTLNAIESSYLFDPNNLVYISGNTSIKSSVFGEQGLPEGTYQLCVRAIDAATRKPLSEEDPLGCSNIFSVATLETPVILNPYDEQALFSAGVQSFPLRWTTPAGAPPSTEYLVRIVEVFGQRNPYDAVLSSPTPFFETTVRGSPLYLYSIRDPRMEEGRTYAMIVVASDPLGNATFRNRGASEVVQFTYGQSGAAQAGQGTSGANGPTTEYANHKITGRLTWAFKKTELSSYVQSTGGTIPAVVQKNYSVDGGTNGNKANQSSTVKAVTGSAFLTASVSNDNYRMQAAITPMLAFNAVAAINADPTLLTNTPGFERVNIKNPQLVLPLPDGIVAGSGSTFAGTTYTDVPVDTAAERFPLAGVSVKLEAVVTDGGMRRVLVGTGQTDKDGNYSIDFIDPAYNASGGATGLILSVAQDDFEFSEFTVPLSVLTTASAELGLHTLLAKTLRLFPKAGFDSLMTDAEKGYGYHIYRDAQELINRPWLASEGALTGEKPKSVFINGRELIEIAADTLPPTGPANPRFKVLSVITGKGAGRIFFGGDLYVRLIAASSEYYEKNSVVNIINAPIPRSKILLAEVDYLFQRKPAHMDGTVSFPNGASGSIPVSGAKVRVIYAKGDGTGGNNPNSFVLKGLQTKTNAVSSALLSGSSPAWTGATLHDPGTTVIQALVYGISPAGLTQPLLLTQSSAVGRNASQTISATPVLNPILEPPAPRTVGTDSAFVMSTTDDLGNYYISLPGLKDGAQVAVEVMNMPADFKMFPVEATGFSASTATLTLPKGVSRTVDFSVKADVADVVGRVVDDKGKALANARIDFKGATLGFTGPDGIFEFTIYPGNHLISLDKEGYVVKQISISIPQLTGKTGNVNTNKWLGMTVNQKSVATIARISSSQTIQASIARGNSFSPLMFGIAAPSQTTNNNGSGPGGLAKEYTSGLAFALGVGPAVPGSNYEVPQEFAVDLKDVGYLNKIVGKARFRIVDENGNAPIAGVSISVFDSSNVTDAKGEWYYEGFGGSATVTLLPPDGTAFAATQKLVTLAETGQETLIVIKMDKGILISGTVTSASAPLPGARILVDELDFGKFSTDAAGHYSMYVTPGAHTMGARKQGYVGADKDADGIKDNNDFNFDLKGSNGHNYSTLLGFGIELDAATPAGGGQEKWTGHFIKVQTADNTVFTFSGDGRIPFSNLLVAFDSRGDAVPGNNIVKTDLTELPMKIFGYLPVKLTGTDVVTFSKNSAGKGQLTGKITVAFGAIQGYRGWSVNDNTALSLGHDGSATPDNIVVALSEGSVSAAQSFALTAGGGNVAGQLYGFAVSLSGGVVDRDGLRFGGSVSTPALDPIKPMAVPITKFVINQALAVSAVLIKDDALQLQIGSWSAAIASGVIFNEDGFRVAGGLNLAIPRSLGGLVSFAQLIISKSDVFGGTFTIPDAGIDVVKLATIDDAGSKLSFGRVGTSNVYRLAGNINFKVNVSLLDRPINVPSFEILTNGDFTIKAPTDLTLPIGPFTFSLTNLNVRALDATPSVVLQGKFQTDFSFLKFEVGDITVRLGPGGGPTFSVGKIGAKLDVPVLTAGVLVAFDNDGFEGDGTLEISGTPIKGTVGFKYYKRPTGMEIGAKFFVNLPPVPIGGIVTLEGIGGGFDYVAGGTNGGFKVDIQGKISVAGTGAAAALDPVGISVDTRGVLKGYGDLVVASSIKKGHAEVIFNGPELSFSVNVDTELEPLGGLASTQLTGALVISAKPGDEYVFLGCRIHVTLLGLIDNDGQYAIAINLKNPMNHDDITSQFFQYAPPNYMGDRFSGVYINVASHVGIPHDDAIGFDLFIVSATAWFDYKYNANLLLNFAENGYHLGFGGGFEMGLEACLVHIACVYISASMCINVDGGYNDRDGWSFDARAAGQAALGFGLGVGDCTPGCNEVVSVWDGCFGGAFKVCGNASVELSFSSAHGIGFSASAGGSDVPCY